jgi:hypothetical protein
MQLSFFLENTRDLQVINQFLDGLIEGESNCLISGEITISWPDAKSKKNGRPHAFHEPFGLNTFIPALHGDRP